MVKPATVSILASVAIAMLSVPTHAQPAQPVATQRATVPLPTAAVHSCLLAAARKHRVDYRLMRAVAEQESGYNPQAIRAPYIAGNKDGSLDYGLMQINSSWLPTLASYGITQRTLLDPCVNADVGAWILADLFRRHGLTWDAVGAYNAKSPEKRYAYAVGVYTKLQRIGQLGAINQDPVEVSPEISMTDGNQQREVQGTTTRAVMGVWERQQLTDGQVRAVDTWQ